MNIAYGSDYLRYLLDHYNGNEMLAVAAYNGGLANVDSWVAAAQAQGHALTVDEIPFAETRAYVNRCSGRSVSIEPTTPASSVCPSRTRGSSSRYAREREPRGARAVMSDMRPPHHFEVAARVPARMV